MRDRRLTIDQQPGRLPEIRADGEGVTFCLAVAGIEKGRRLVIRCDPDGNVWVSIDSE